MRETFAAVVVTFNRKQLLLECLQALKKQTRPLDRIFVIDNASSDGTPEFLEESGILRDPIFEYVRLGENTGGAGGFHEGLRRAFDSGYDWFWLMDDDVEAYPEGLERLLPFCSRSGCIHGRRMNPDQTPATWGELFNPRTVTTTPDPDRLFCGGREAHELNVGCFEGMLVSRKVISKIGFPDPRFFICLDDTFFGYLASRVTSVLYVNAYSLRRKLSTASLKSSTFNSRDWPLLSPTSLYYFSRNRFLVARALGNFSVPFIYSSVRILVRSTFRELVIRKSWKGARAVVGGFWDGMRCWLGMRVPSTGPR